MQLSKCAKALAPKAAEVNLILGWTFHSFDSEVGALHEAYIRVVKGSQPTPPFTGVVWLVHGGAIQAP